MPSRYWSKGCLGGVCLLVLEGRVNCPIDTLAFRKKSERFITLAPSSCLRSSLRRARCFLLLALLPNLFSVEMAVVVIVEKSNTVMSKGF